MTVHLVVALNLNSELIILQLHLLKFPPHQSYFIKKLSGCSQYDIKHIHTAASNQWGHGQNVHVWKCDGKYPGAICESYSTDVPLSA